MQAQLKTARHVPPLREADTRPIPIAIGINRACKADPKEKLFLIPIAIGTNASKKIKNATYSRHSMTLKLNTDNGLQGQWRRTTGYNTNCAKVAVQCSLPVPIQAGADTFSAKAGQVVVNQSLVLRINPDSYRDGENRHLRQARKRYMRF